MRVGRPVITVIGRHSDDGESKQWL